MFSGLKRIVLIFVFVVLIIISAVIYGRVFSYDTEVAHPFLTEKAVELFNQNSEIQISQQQLGWMRQGAIEEDTPIRWMNHFYNPITGNGLWGFSSAKDWSREDIKQLFYPKGNQTWQKAISSYAKGDKKEAFIALGHILHLIEDMSVPAHTRDDAHPEGDPYESWAKNNAEKNFEGVSVTNFDNLDNFFDLLAGYSNKYFLSKDSINVILLKDLKTKTVYSDGKIIDCLLSYDENNKEFCIISSDKNFINPQQKIYYFTSINHSDYYSLLAPKAISYGAGVIDLFFQEVEIEEQKQQEKSWLDKLKEKIGITQPAAPGVVLVPPTPPTSDVGSESLSETAAPTSPAEPISPIEQVDPIGQIVSAPSPAPVPTPIPAPLASPSPLPTPIPALLPYPGFGGGVPPPPAGTSDVDAENPETAPEPEPEPQPPADTTPPDVSLSILECQNSLATSAGDCLLATTTLNIIWSSSAGDLDYFEINLNGEIRATTSTSTTVVELKDNSTNIFSVRAKDKTGNWSESQTTTVVVSSMPVVINEVGWGGTGGHPQDEWIELYNRTDYDIDFDNNNWVLYSATDQTPYINLSGVIPTKGYYLIERKNTGEKEEATESPIQDITANLWTSFSYGLNNSGEVLILSFASTTIDQTSSGSWAGGNERGWSMERYEPDLPGNNSANWGTNNTTIRNGKNVDKQDINGTPKARNSLNYLIAKGASSISSDITLTKANSPYLVAGMNHDSIIQSFQASSTLRIEPGVVIKFYGGGMNFIENAKIIAEGKVDAPIIFTSFNDDENPEWDIDGVISTSTPSSWYGVELKTKNQESVFDNVIFRYGGGYTDLTGSRANLYIADTSAGITHSTFEYSKLYGLMLVNSNSKVSENIFRNNNPDPALPSYGSGAAVNAGNPIIQNNQFLNNHRGLYLGNSRGIVDANRFQANSGEAVYSSGSLPTFINNYSSDSTINAITINNGLTQENSTTTLYFNPLPYVLDGVASVSASSTLIVEKGAEIKSGQINVWGTMIIKKEDGNDFLFSSVNVYFINGTGTATTTPPGL